MGMREHEMRAGDRVAVAEGYSVGESLELGYGCLLDS